MLSSPMRHVSRLLSGAHVQTRVIATYLALMGAVLATVLTTAHFGLGRQAVETRDQQLHAVGELLKQSLESRRQLLRRDALALSAAAKLSEALERGDGHLLARWLKDQAETPAQQAILLDASGQVQLASSVLAMVERPMAHWPAVSPSASEPLPAQLDGWWASAAPAESSSAAGIPLQWAAAPVRLPGFVGWIVLSTRMDDLVLAQLAARAQPSVPVDLHLALVQKNATTSSDLAWRVTSSTLGTSLQAQLSRQLQQDAQAVVRPWRSDLFVAGQPMALMAPGGEVAASALKLLVLTRPLGALPFARLELTLAALSTLGLLMFLLGSLHTAKRLLGPLQELTASASRLGGGDYDTPICVQASGEIAELAQAFEGMRRAVQQREQQVHLLAFRDTLTGLPNREQFRRDLIREADLSQGGGPGCAVIFLDLNRFKRINDVLGQRYGDKVLRQVGGRLREVIADQDMVARLGGDEFAVLLHGDRSRADSMAACILTALRDAGQVDEHVIDVSASMGISVCPEHGYDPDLLLARAEQAMVVAKQQKQSVLVYNSTFDREDNSDLGLMSELRRAIDANHLRLVLQPKIELATGKLVGAEALVRWMHPERGELLPASFIPFAEQTGAVSEVTRWMIQRAVMACRRLHKEGLDVRVSVNLSARDLLNRDLPRQVLDLIEHVKIKPRWLVLEITESELMQDPDRARQILQDMHAIGVGLSIDDFGTGYSSLGYLKRLPVDELKIDRSFVMNMERSVHDAKIVRSTVDLAHNLGLRVVAEGLESAKSWKLLAGLNCDEAQGYFIAAAMEPDAFLEWARAWVPPHTADEGLPTEIAAMI